MKRRWNIGTILWFAFYIFCQWLMFIEYITRQIIYPQAILIYGVSGLVGTALILWLAISKKKIALQVMLVIAGIGAVIALFSSGIFSALMGLILPGINWLIVRKRVE